MTILDAWNACGHGGIISRPGGLKIERWMGEKPGQKSSFDRWLDENITLIVSADLLAVDWIVDA